MALVASFPCLLPHLVLLVAQNISLLQWLSHTQGAAFLCRINPNKASILRFQPAQKYSAVPSCRRSLCEFLWISASRSWLFKRQNWKRRTVSAGSALLFSGDVRCCYSQLNCQLWRVGSSINEVVAQDIKNVCGSRVAELREVFLSFKSARKYL